MPEPLVVIVGPTAVGKTEIGVALAERLHGEVVSADSRYFYRGLDIGSAKPSLAERRGVPHHLIDVADPDETWSLALFRQRAMAAIDDIHRRGKLPLLVGGAGQYIRAVTQGWLPPAVEPHPQLRQSLEACAQQVGALGLHQRLAALDPAAAQGIDYRNLRRTVRALEVILTSGRRFSEQRRAQPAPYRSLQIGLFRPRSELYERIDRRIAQMLRDGLVEEVQRLLQAGYERSLPAMSAIGYREVAAYLQGEISLEEAVAQMQRSTRTFVRRQANWFKPDDPEITWFTMRPGVQEDILTRLTTWLTT